MIEKMSWDDEEWLFKRQAVYDRMTAALPARPKVDQYEITLEIVKQIDKLPYEEGGRQFAVADSTDPARESYLFVHIEQDIVKAGECNRRGKLYEARDLVLGVMQMAGELGAILELKVGDD